MNNRYFDKLIIKIYYYIIDFIFVTKMDKT